MYMKKFWICFSFSQIILFSASLFSLFSYLNLFFFSSFFSQSNKERKTSLYWILHIYRLETGCPCYAITLMRPGGIILPSSKSRKYHEMLFSGVLTCHFSLSSHPSVTYGTQIHNKTGGNKHYRLLHKLGMLSCCSVITSLPEGQGIAWLLESLAISRVHLHLSPSPAPSIKHTLQNLNVIIGETLVNPI